MSTEAGQEFGRFREYFPEYLPFGLRELAVTQDLVEVLRWVTVALERSPDALDPYRRSGFVHWSESLATEVHAACSALVRMLSTEPTLHVDEQVTVLEETRTSLELSGSEQSRSAVEWAQLFDALVAI